MYVCVCGEGISNLKRRKRSSSQSPSVVETVQGLWVGAWGGDLATGLSSSLRRGCPCAPLCGSFERSLSKHLSAQALSAWTPASDGHLRLSHFTWEQVEGSRAHSPGRGCHVQCLHPGRAVQR